MNKEIIDDQIYDVDLISDLITWSNFKGGVILDVGGSLGYFSKKILSYYPDSSVISIEPSKRNFKYLYDNVKDLNVLPIYGAVTNGENEVTFYENYNVNQGSIIMSNYLEYWDNTIKDTYTVQGYDFKKLVNTLNPNLIKIDIEGYEYFLDYSNLPDSVNTIAMEVHMSDIDYEGNKLPNIIDNDLEVYTEITEVLKSQGFDYIKPPIVVFPWDGTWDGSNRTHLVCLTR